MIEQLQTFTTTGIKSKNTSLLIIRTKLTPILISNKRHTIFEKIQNILSQIPFDKSETYR